MIIKRIWWVNRGKEKGHRKEGWFLFGLLPLYIRTVGIPG